MLKFVPGIAVAIALTATAIPLNAEEGETVRVAYGDLDLRKAGDVSRLKKRVVGEIRKVCGTTALPVYGTSDCERDATRRAMIEIERHRVRYVALAPQPVG
ncbi:hypothetical protein A6F68_00715 [Tsuneonella dongtanensis]|uniref:UrcA family protein n=1 Tax=Tsuneonella dongtanensis TaxID=692370 RepID=A0A1B2AAW5_9SPHN|nr:UrcA family protein [Tsuneonella dongtanensis]ANY19244.1 hypothetical protein A6F68_00715 [Tsuneonella dongtanensis]